MPSVPRVLERLWAEHKIPRTLYEATLTHWRVSGGFVEESMLETGLISESDLLKLLATLYRTRYISTEKLSRATIDRNTLDFVPRKIAERYLVCPVLFDSKTATLSVITYDPDPIQALEEVRLVSRARIVQPLIARPFAIKAAIEKFYNNDKSAFLSILRNEQSNVTELEFFQRPSATLELEASRTSVSTQVAFATSAVLPATTVVNSPVPHVPQEQSVVAERPHSEPQATPHTSAAAKPSVTIEPEAWLETLNVFISMLENQRGDLKGHSVLVAQLTRKFCERIGLPEHEIWPIVAAAYLHDIGKNSAYHLTALNVVQSGEARLAARKTFLTPCRLMESARLPETTISAIQYMYEHFDGGGFPEGRAGKEIPLGARIVAITDTYAELTQNAHNLFGKTFTPSAAGEILAQSSDRIFDGNLIDIFRHIVTDDDLRIKLLAHRHSVLFVDPDPEETTVLELRMLELGFDVSIARSAEQALREISKGQVELVVSEVELEPFDGFALLEKIRQTDFGRSLTWVYLTSRAENADVHRGFELGAIDYIQKPIRPQILAAKLRKLIEQTSALKPSQGASGSLEEMSLTDLVQILAQGRKTCALKVQSGSDSGEIHFVQGEIFNAIWSKIKGEDAFYTMLKLKTGRFSLDLNFKAPNRLIQGSTQGLLLEGMRRLDEGI